MCRHSYPGAIAVVAAVLLGFASTTPTFPVKYCASSNTAASPSTSSIYQSQGLCYGQCNDQGFAFAVLQNKLCWCSNLIPSSDDQTSTSKCESSCPGYPTDYCGGDGVFAYIALKAAPSGSAGDNSPQNTPPPPKTPPAPSSKPTTPTKPPSSDPEPNREPDVPTPPPKKPSEPPPAQSGPMTITAVQTVTSAGTIIIQTVTTVSTPVPQSDNSGLGKGALAGIIVGIIAAILAFILGAVLFRRHKRSLREEKQPMTPSSMAHRRGSSAAFMSKTGTMSSMGYGITMDDEGSHGSQSRRLSMKPLDPRLDPKVGLYRAASHDSFNTIRDDQDYSRRVHEPPRTFRVTNPDPDD